MGKGIDSSPVSYYWERDEIKSIGHSYTLPFDTSDTELIKSYILMLCQKVTTRLWKERKAAQTVVLTIRYSDFSMFSRQRTVGCFVDTIQGIYRVCLEILREIGELAKPVRLLGVSVTSLTEGLKQLYLFEEFEREEKLNKAIGEINSKFGEFTVKPACLLLVGRISGKSLY
jgi:DNA polymerase-4